MTPDLKQAGLDDAPAHLASCEAAAWSFGYNSGAFDALQEAIKVATERGGADGLVIAGKLRELSERFE